MEHILTAAALRVIEAARRVLSHSSPAGTDSSTQGSAISASDWIAEEAVFAAIIEEESVAHQRLVEHGLDIDDLKERMGRTGSTPPGADNLFTAKNDAEHGAWGVSLERIIRQARHEAHKSSQPEVGTEHLLRALFEIDGWLNDWLAREQLTPNPTKDGMGSANMSTLSDTPLEHDSITLPEVAPPQNLTAVYRLLDASANRAREGLRVIEDSVRMIGNDGWLSRQLKEMRHALSSALRILPDDALLASRDTPGDVGTRISTTAEGIRTSTADVVAAGFKRLQESLRSLEEYGKIVDGYFASRIEPIRYQSYTIEKVVRLSELAHTTLDDRPLYLLLTEKLCRQPVGQTLKAALQAGVRIVQVREKAMSDRILVDHVRRVGDLAHEYNALVVMNDRADLAAIAETDGIHVGQDELTIAQVRRIVGPRMMVGVSTHALDQAEAAVRDGATYIGVGPTFPTTTKSFIEFAGLDYISEIAREIALPAYAIGGITLENAASVVSAGATRLAVSSAICSAEDPYVATMKLMEILSTATVIND